uniref:M3 family metallopeptidase n=1 Tax=Candidatus Cryptobacteroides bacterium TaxID=3085639 RepID=UPI004028F336
MNKRILAAAGAILCLLSSCDNKMNPLLTDSTLPYGAPQFDKIKTEHYLPAFEQAITEAKAEIDAIVNNPDAPTFENTIAALDEAGGRLNDAAGIFYNLMEADTNDQMQDIAEKVSPMMTEYSMYVSLNEPLFARVKAVHESAEGLEPDQARLLEKTWKSFVRSGANLGAEDKETYSKLSEQLSLLTLQYGKNVLAATNAFTLNLTDEADLEGLPDFVREAAVETAKSKEMEGWAFDLSAPSYGAFMKYSTRRDLRQKMWMAYNTRASEGENSNIELCRQIAESRLKIANILGYETYADYALEERMAKNPQTVNEFIQKLLEPSLPAAKAEVKELYEYARANGFEDSEIQPWDFGFWSEKLKDARYSINDEQLKPYFRLESCIDAAFGLAGKLYGLTFEERKDIPVYHPDVKVYDVKDADGVHKALFYADFFPRASKRGGAWMTEFRGQSIVNGVEKRPFISLVTNFTKPTAGKPALLTHDELTTLLHEFGHSLHGILAEGRYSSLTGTNVSRDFVELPSQIMENWAFEPEFLDTFARHFETGEALPDTLINKIVEAKNYNAAYAQVRQLQFGILDMAWHTLKGGSESGHFDRLSDLKTMQELGTIAFEKAALKSSNVIPSIPQACISTSFSHIFSGGYSAGYYSYKWSEVLEADAFSLFKEKGIFSTEVSHSFRDNILSKGCSEDEDVLYRRFRGHDPEPEALLEKLGIVRN